MSDVPCETSCAIWVSAYRILCSVDALIEQIQDHTIFDDCKDNCTNVRHHIANARAEIEYMTKNDMTLKAALAPLIQHNTDETTTVVQRIDPKDWVFESEPSSIYERLEPASKPLLICDEPKPAEQDPVESVMELL